MNEEQRKELCVNEGN